MSFGQTSLILCYIIGFFCGLLLLPCVDTTARFTRFPPSVLYVSSGRTARFEWDYHVDNRLNEFQSESPQWHFINPTTLSESKIGYDDLYKSWKFIINTATCPRRLLNPVRVTREPKATLVITNVTTADNGIYRCRLQFVVGSPIQHQVELVVTVRPSFLPSHPSNTYNIIEGQDLRINCKASGPPTPNITWVNTKDGSVVIKSQGSGSAVLQIDNIRRYHAGAYECQAKNNPNKDTTSTRTRVTVYYSPEIIHFSEDKIINEGSSMTLNCSASGCPQPAIFWSNEKGFLRHGDSLAISGATKNDTGNYTCTAKNVYGGKEHLDQAHIYVTVKYKPSTVYWTKDQIIDETHPLHLTCIADGYPAPSITWTKTPGSMTPSLTTGNKYSLQSVNRSDAGTYTCTASNEMGSANKNIAVVVQYQPTISKQQSSTNFSSWNGRQVTLNCIISDGVPAPNITWYNPNGQQMTTGVTAIANAIQVVITTTNSADYGSYKCKATNVAGSDEHVINVTQLFSPGPHSVTILDQDIQASSVHVRWTKPGYDGGSPVIDYKVQINTDPPQEKNTSNTEHEFTGLTKNTRYEVRVYARNVVGYGNVSIIKFTTKKRGPPPLPSLDLSKSETKITLKWTKPDENGGTIMSYTIYQKQGAGGTWTSIHVVRDLSNLAYVLQVKDLEPGETYWFIVTATNEFGESEIGSSNKGEEVHVSPKVTTATTSTTTAIGGQSINKQDKEEKCSAYVAALAVCATLLVVSLFIIVLLLIYIWKNIKRKEPHGNTNTKRVKARKQAVEDPVYDNALEMEENQHSDTPQQTSPPGEYEPIKFSSGDHPTAISNREDGYSNTFTETPSHYQELSHPDTAGSSHQGQGQGPTYEPLQRPQFKAPGAGQTRDVPGTNYQPLGVRLNPTEYQSLRTYNMHDQPENNRNEQSII